MYIPKHFEETDTAKLLGLIEQYPFSMLVTTNDGVPFVSHLPLVVEAVTDLKVVGHMAKSNEQWEHFNGGAEALAVFQGPHAYVSPSWYDGPGVPTWNYAAIHLYGKPEIVAGKERTRNIVHSLTEKFEISQKTPWAPEYPPRLLDAIVGFEIKVSRIEGKYKLSQNRSEADRGRVIGALESSASENARGIARLMKE